MSSARSGAAVRRMGIVVMAQDRHRDHVIVTVDPDAAHAGRIPALEDAHVLDGEADALATRRGHQHVVGEGADIDTGDLVARVELHVERHMFAKELAISIYLLTYKNKN